VIEASRSNLEIVRRLLSNSAPRGEEIRSKGTQGTFGTLANGALLEVGDTKGVWLLQSPQFRQTVPPLEPVRAERMLFATTNLQAQQYRVAAEMMEAGGRYEVRAAVPTEPFDEALDSFRLIGNEALPVLVLLAALLGYWLSGQSLQSVNRIMQTAEQIGAQNLSLRLEVPPAKDESYAA
jgi:hypothetical protein